MTDPLVAILENTVAGTVTRDARGRLRFDYADDYQHALNATPLSVSMPPQVRSHRDREIDPWLWGLLPDNDAVLSRWARQFQVARAPFALLATPIGEDCAGAVRFASPDHVNDALSRSGEVAWITEDDVAALLRDLIEDSTTWLGRNFTGQFSLAGAQAKTALLFRDGQWGIPSGATPTTHILKPAVAGLDDHDLNEHLCLDAARRVGLLAARTRVAQFGDQSAIVVDRYDRVEGDAGVTRIHQEDVCQALSVYPRDKYQNAGGPSPKDIAALLRRVMAPRDADAAVCRFADALIWNWLIGGTDAHAKNYSLLLAGDQVRFAPIYDVASALPYGMHEKKLRMAMKLGSSYDVFPHHNSWPRAARDLGLKVDTLIDRVRELAAAAPRAFDDAAHATDVVALDRPLPATLVDLVADRAERCVRLVSTSVGTA